MDAYYEGLPLVIEYWERQHTEPTPFMDQRQTCCGCNRGEQRKLYDRRKSTVLQNYDIPLIVLDYRMFQCTGQGRLRRAASQDEAVIRATLSGFPSPQDVAKSRAKIAAAQRARWVKVRKTKQKG